MNEQIEEGTVIGVAETGELGTVILVGRRNGRPWRCLVEMAFDKALQWYDVEELVPVLLVGGKGANGISPEMLDLYRTHHDPRPATIYVSGPYTAGDPVLNVRAACLAAEQLRDKGWLPFVPHLSHLWHLVNPHEYAYWLSMDLEWVNVCNAILRLPGESAGADKEVALAKAIGKMVYYAVEDVPQTDSTYDHNVKG